MRTPLLAVLAAALLAGCANQASTAIDPHTSVAPAITVTSGPAATPQGFLPRKLGEETGLGCTSSAITSCTVRFAVTAIDVSPACDKYRTAPPAGQKTVVLHVTITTTTAEKQDTSRAGLLFSAVQLKGVGPGGQITPVNYGSCWDRPGALVRDIGPGARYEGFLEVAVDQAATSIATSPAGKASPAGWVWPLG